MPENRFMYKRLYFIGFTAYLAMFVLSVLFYKERTLFLDAAFCLFHIIKDNSFCIQHYRFGDICTQILPVIATKAGLSLHSILESYSAGFIIYYFITYFICGSVLKRYDLALVILLMNILFVSDTFYWMLSQLPQAVALLMVLFAMISGRNLKTTGPLMWVMIFIVEATIIFFHPLVVFVLVFAILFFKLSKSANIDSRLLYALAIIYFTGMALKVFLFKTPYEDHSASGLKNFVTQFPDYFTLFSNKRFLYNCLVKYYWIPVVFTANAIFYIKTKEVKKLLIFIVFFFAYLMLVNIAYPTAVTPEFYIENLYLPLSIILALPFVFDVLPVLGKNNISIVIIVLIISSGCIRLYATHTIYSDRLVLERKYLDEYGDKKVIVKAKRTDTETWLMLWGTPYEFLLLSASERNKPASIIIDEDPPRRGWATDQKKSLVVNWNIYPYKELNPKYFHFTDTATGYIIDK